MTYRKAGELHLALEYYFKYVNNTAYLTYHTYQDISEIYEQLGDTEKAREYKQKAELLCQTK